MAQILYLLLSILTLGFLVFIHELGHYYTARKVGMRVEAFSIGFGRPLYRWTHDGVQWQICWIPFGGYVKIAGMEDEENTPKNAEGTFFSKTPFQRIKVALSGPSTNLFFAFAIFSVLWMTNGRQKNFSEYTHYIGWVDPQSELYAKGVRPGDAVVAYNNHAFKGNLDHLEAAILSKEQIDVAVEKHDYSAIAPNASTHIEHFKVHGKPHPAALQPDFMTTGVVNSAQYLIYDRLPGGQENPINAASPMLKSGLQYGDRIVWANGELIFSVEQLSQIVNEPKILLTVQRGEKTFLSKSVRLPIGEYSLNAAQKAELTDWQYDGEIKGRIEKLLFIPYQISEEAIVVQKYTFFDSDTERQAFPTTTFSDKEQPLQHGDRILAIDGTAISTAKDLLQQIQTKKVLMMAEHNQHLSQGKAKLSTDMDNSFTSSFPIKDIQAIAETIGHDAILHEVRDVVLLHPVEPKVWRDIPLSAEEKSKGEQEALRQTQEISKIEDAQMRQRALQMLEKQEEKLMLFVAFQDQKVTYNPLPWIVMKESVMSTWRILNALIQGVMSPKWLAGPVGIVNLMQTRFQLGLPEALFWMASISMQLGLLNLLPVPVFDGGHVCFALWEMMTGKRPKGKVIEMIISACVIVLILFAIYVTYHDLTR